MKSKICTTIDQCKKLLDLGIDINTADLTVTNYPLQDGSRFDFICCKLPNDTFPSITDGKSERIPAWSLSALLDYLSANFHVDIKHLDNYWELDCRVQVSYGKELVDACCYEMIVKLHEQNLL